MIKSTSYTVIDKYIKDHLPNTEEKKNLKNILKLIGKNIIVVKQIIVY